MTPHNHAKQGDYAEAVLLPGDPLRAKWIAETFFDAPKLVNSVRNCLGYTGTWKGQPVSVQATGMGQPSLAIYVHELINVYGLKTLIRVGTCGGLNAKVKVRDVILAQAASTDSSIVKDRFGAFNFAPTADFGLLRDAANKADAAGIRYHAGNMLSSDNNDAARLTNFQGWRTGFYDKQLNTDIDQALLERDPEKQKQDYFAIQERYDALIPALVPLSQMVDSIVVRKDVKNYLPHPSATTFLRDVYKDDTADARPTGGKGL